MLKYIAKRLGYAILVLLGVSLIIYFLTRLMPIDFVRDKVAAVQTSGAEVTQEMVDAMYKVGLSLPFELRETALGGCAATPTGCSLCSSCMK